MTSNNRVVVLNYAIDCDTLNAEIPFLLKNVGLSVYGYNTFTHHFWGKVVNRGVCVFSVYIQLKKGGANNTIVTVDADIYDELLMKTVIADFKKEMSYIVDQHDMFTKFDIKINSRSTQLVAAR
jgi:hypothetical protein